MSHSVQMPALGESVTEGTVTRWLKSEGESVDVDEPLLEVSTDKVDTEIPSPYGGVLEKILVGEDETAAVGAELAIIGDGSGASSGNGGAAAPAAEPEPAAQPEPEPEAAPAAQAAPAEAPSTEAEAPAEKPTAGAAPASGSGTSVTLPEMGESVTEGTVTRWLKAVGDDVALDEPLVEVSTDKVDTEIPSPVAGTLLEITVGEDQTIEVGGQLGVIGDASAAPAAAPAAAPEPAAATPARAPEPAPAPQAPAAAAPAAPAAAPAAPKPPAQAIPSAPVPEGTYVTPVIRKLAADSGVDLSSVKGTGVGGRIRREDVVAAAEAAKAAVAAAATPAAPAPAAAAPAPAAAKASGSSVPKPDDAATALIGTTQKLPRIRQSIAKNMKFGLDTAAQLTTVMEVDVTRVAALRARAKTGFAAREGVNLSFLPFFVKAALEAAKAYPVINSTLSEDIKEITYHGSVNLGIAVDTPRGLIVPVIKGADDLNLAGIARKIADLAKRTRDNKIGPDELSGGTFTITNTGSVGALFDTPIFVPPQSAILGTGAIVKRPMVIKDGDGNEVIAIRSMCYLAISYDHRNIDGADASRFLGAVKRRIEAGEFEGDLGL
jgi:pyruvate dehydrogenase E2 component (dihydrolipoamide acetyltransferase)